MTWKKDSSDMKEGRNDNVTVTRKKGSSDMKKGRNDNVTVTWERVVVT